MGVGQNLLLSILMGWTSIYQLFWGSPGVQGFDPSPYVDHKLVGLGGSDIRILEREELLHPTARFFCGFPLGKSSIFSDWQFKMHIPV